MLTSSAGGPRGRTVIALLSAVLTAQLTGCSSSPPDVVPATTLVRPHSGTARTPSNGTSGTVTITLRVGEQRALATLADTPQAHQFAAMLPLRLTLRDPMGQAKSGRLPARIDLGSDVAARTTDPEVAGIYYWPPSCGLGIVYDDLGQSVPAPGLVRLGTVDLGLDVVASAGNHFTVSIERT